MTDGFWRKGDRLMLTCGSATVPAEVLLASENSRSLMLQYEGMVANHAGMMPVLIDINGDYRTLVTDKEVGRSKII